MPKALLSVSDKSGLLNFAQGLVSLGYELLSTGGTARMLREGGLEVQDVSDYTGFPEMMNGRVKTLHPKVHGGLLALREDESHMEQAKKNSVEMIDLVVVNLYPFEAVTANKDVSLADAIENIDIGGPSMLRSAAKNHSSVTVICEPGDYEPVLSELKNGGTQLETRQSLALKVYQRTAAYDSAIQSFLASAYKKDSDLHLHYKKSTALRYGENPHQKATLYKNGQSGTTSLPDSELVHGKEMSYNNYLDAHGALLSLADVKAEHAVSVIKHSNPCGLATGNSLKEAIEMAWEGDIVSAFGSIIACTSEMTLEAAKVLEGRFVEVVLAPSYSAEALDYLKKKSKNLRIIQLNAAISSVTASKQYRQILGGMLEQDADRSLINELKAVTKETLSEEDMALMEFAYAASKAIKSNGIAIAVAYDKGRFMLLGMGAGQPNRVDSIRKLAITKARENIERLFPDKSYEEMMAKAVLASDAFFPFPDNIQEASAAGLKKIVQPGGSMRDNEVIAACDELGIAMAFTGMRHFNH